MSRMILPPLSTAGLAALLLLPDARAQNSPPIDAPPPAASEPQALLAPDLDRATDSVAAQLESLRRQLAEQGAIIDQLRKALAARPAAAATPEELGDARGAGQGHTGLPKGAASPAGVRSNFAGAGGAEVKSAGPTGAGAKGASSADAEDESARADARGAGAGGSGTVPSGTATAPPLAGTLAAPGASTTVAMAASSTTSSKEAATAPSAAPQSAQVEAAEREARRLARPASRAPAPAKASARAQNAATHSAPARPPEVAPLFEQPGVLTPRGKLVFEPALQFGYSSSNRVALVGYTVIPALLIGLVDVREIKRNTTTLLLAGRYGVSNRLEIDARLPYVYRSDATVSREIFTGTAVENVFSTSGKDIGDAELGLRYQLNQGGVDRPFYVASLRLKSRTGRDPFSVVTDCTRRCIGPNASGTGLPLELPTGSGFYSIQPGLTWLFPSDPAVFFGSVSYLHNVRRKNVSRTVLGGEQEFLGDVAPGAVAGVNFGMGLGLNDKSSLSLGYDHSSIGKTRQGGIPVPGAVRTQLGTLLLGFSYRLNARRSINVSVGAGLTRDTPDVSITLRLPTTF